MGTGPCAGPGPGSEQYLWFYGHNLGTGAWCPGRRGLPVLQGFLPPALQEKEEPPESISPLRLRKPLLPQPLGKLKKKKNTENVSVHLLPGLPQGPRARAEAGKGPAEPLVADPALQHEALSLEGICLRAGGIKGRLREPPLLQHR